MATFSTRTLRLPSVPVHGTLFVPAVAEPVTAVLLIGGSGGSEPSYVGLHDHGTWSAIFTAQVP